MNERTMVTKDMTEKDSYQNKKESEECYRKFLKKCELMKQESWLIQHSSLVKRCLATRVQLEKFPTFDECWKYACDCISNGTRLQRVPRVGEVVEVNGEQSFHFMVRVDTTVQIIVDGTTITPKVYYKTFESREFVSFSTIWQDNVSHYMGSPLFVYNINPEDIVHIFPMDSSTFMYAKHSKDLTNAPNLLLDLKDIDNLSTEMGCYPQITCRTKRNGRIIKPVAIAVLNNITSEDAKIAESFGLGIFRIITSHKAIRYDKDVLCDPLQLLRCKNVMLREFDFDAEFLAIAE